MSNLASFTDILGDEICNSQPLSLPSSFGCYESPHTENLIAKCRPPKGAGQHGEFRSVEEIDPKYRDVFSYPFFNIVQSNVIEDALYSDKSMVVCAPTGSGKTVVFEMAIVQLLMELEDQKYNEDFKIIYMAPVKALCTEKLTEWYPKFTKLGLLCIEVTGDTDVDFSQLKPYRMIITTPEKWDMLTRRWRDHKGLVEMVKLFLIDEVHILNDETRGPVLEAVVSRMKTIESSAQSAHRIEQLQQELKGGEASKRSRPRIRFVAVSATVSNPEDVAAWLGTNYKPAVYYKFGDECRPVKLKRIVEGYPCPEGTSIFKFDIILNYKLWPIIQKHHAGKPTLIFCNTRKSVTLTAETLSRELTVSFNPEQKAKLAALASTIKNKKLQSLVMSGVGCHHAGLLFEERMNIERAFRNRDLPILITTTTLAMGVNLPAHLVIIKNTQQYVNGAYQEYSISTVLQMVGRAGRPQFDTEATAVIMTRLADKPRYQSLVGGSEPLQSYLHKRLAENLNSEAALGTVGDVAQCVQWLRSTFLFVRAARDPRRYLSLPQNSPQHLISKKIEELCVKAMNKLASSGLITMDEASCIESTEAGRLMSIFYLDLETMKLIMKIEGTESLERLLWLICESHELADMHLRMDERRCLNTLNRNNTAATIRYPMKGKITTRQMKLNCVIQAILGCLPIPDPSLGQEAMKIMRTADRVCKCLVSYVIRPDLVSHQPQFYSAVLNTLILAKCIAAQLWENSPYLSKQLKGIGPTFSTLLATAGKTNFMLLEESHPRDLERIMNKGPPAGNVLRKQVSLLPKYQLMITAVDERTISMELVLLNQSYLSENMENLTAGEHHKSYIVVGDSSNHLLLLTSFKDKDLISVYDGTIKYELKRKHDLEHKVFAHCISSSFVGIDAHAEYSFNDLEHLLPQKNLDSHEHLPIKNTTKKQTCITDTFKERKRKNTNAIDLTQSKEKRKRDYAVIEKFKSLKESFGFCTKEPKVYRPEIRDKIDFALNNEGSKPKPSIDITRNDVVPINPKSKDLNEVSLHDFNAEDIDYDENIDNAQIDSILNDIENEISKVRSNSNNSIEPMRSNNLHSCNNIKITPNKTNNAKEDSVHLNTKRKSKPLTNKTNNYNFIDLLERNLDITDDEEKSDEAPKQNGFSETIKCYLNKYLQKTEHTNKLPDGNIKKILENTENTIQNDTVPQKVHLETLLTEASTTLEHLSRPGTQYEIKEIMEPMAPIKLSNENIICDHIDKIIDMDIVNIENTQDEKQNELKNNESCNGKNQDSHDPYLQHTKGASVSYAHENDIFDTDAGTVQQEIDSKTLLTKSSATLKHSSEPGNYYENKEILKYIKPLKQSSKATHDKDKVTDTRVINIVNIGDVKQNELKSVDSCKSNGSHNDSNDTCRQHKIDELVLFERTNYINPIVASNSDSTTDGISDDHLTKLKTATIANIPSQVNTTEKDNPIVSFGSGENESKQRKIIECSRSGNINVEDRYEKIHNSTLHFESNYNNNHPSSSEYLYNENKYPSGTISVLSHNHFDEMEERVNNYSFSAIKIDTCTKDSVKILRKVKVDVNISEIISREKDTNQKNKCNEKCENKDPSGFNEFITLRPNKQARNESITISNKEIASKNNLTGMQLKHTLNTQKKECLSTEKNNELNERIPGEEIQDIKVNKDQTKTPKVQYLEQINEIDSEPVIKETANTENNKLKNILDRYSKILGEKTSTNTITPTQLNSNKASQSYKKSSELKPNRPFKISEIHRIQAPLPTVLIDEKRADINVYCPKIEANIDISENKSEELDIQYYDQSDSDDNIEIPDYQYSNLETLNIPVDVDLEPSKDYKIDNSMFDPKTLLQCVVESDDEIIPPPPQFCDESDSVDNVHEITVSENHNQWCADSENNSAVGYDDEFNDSIFKYNCDAELTPSKEIETWTLPREDIWEGLGSNPIQSYTVMRKNTPDDDALHVSLPRQVRLGKFKFNHKNKFKIRR